MPNGFFNQPKILRGAFVEFGLSLPPLFVVFQFNPERITRSRNTGFAMPGADEPPANDGKSSNGDKKRASPAQRLTIRDFHKKHKDLTELRDLQTASIQEESISFDIRLDATDGMNEGETIATQFGIAPQLATLEQMMIPKSESILGGMVDSLLQSKTGFSFTNVEKPPIILFIWGRKRVLPVNLTGMSIVEEEFSAELNPIRATVNVSLQVIEGENPPYQYTRVMREAMAVLNLKNLPNVAKTVTPL